MGEISTAELFDAIYRVVHQLEKKMDTLRETDRDQVKTAHLDMKERLEGFPQQFATKSELKGIGNVVAKLDKETVAREFYDNAHKSLEEKVNQKLDIQTFNTFVENYRLDLDRASRERSEVATTLATTTARSLGAQSTWKLQAAIIAAAVGILSLVVLLANNVFH